MYLQLEHKYNLTKTNMPEAQDHDLLVRIDERTKNWETTLKTFVTKNEFMPVKALVYGFATLILISVVGGLVALVMHK